MKREYFLVATLLVLSVGCEGPAPVAVDMVAERTAILAADEAWSETAGDLDAFVEFFAVDARFLPPDAPQANGHDEIRESLSALGALPGFSLGWSANFADVSSSGDLGYSVGTFEMTIDGPDGRPATRTGTYTTVWKKQNDGQWKVISDVPNFDSPAGSSAGGQEEAQSLYQRLGGYEVLVAIVDGVGSRIRDDPDFAEFLADRDAEEGQRDRELGILHLCEAAGGACTYIGRDLRETHAGMGIMDEHWQSFMDHLGDALNELNVAGVERAEVISIFSNLRDEIVDGTQ